MKRCARVCAIVAMAGLAVLALLAWLLPGMAYSGPGIAGNLRSIARAKQVWLANGGTNEWPTAADLFSQDGKGTVALTQRMRHTPNREIHFINHTGTPPLAYIPKAPRHYRGGEVLVLTSNGLAVIHQ